MTAIARNQSSSVANPVLVALARDGGFLVDAYSLQYQIFDTSTEAKRLVPVQVYPVTGGTKATVNLVTDRLGLGRYAAAWTAGGAETLGRHMIRWFLKLTSTSSEWTWDREFEVLAGAGYGAAMPSAYCMLCDLREQGILDADASDAKLLLLANEASRLLERFTGRFFEPRHQTIVVDGTGAEKLLLDQPIVAVEEVLLTSPLIDDSDIEGTDFQVYNRHLSQGLISPDDRENPKLDLASYGEFVTEEVDFVPRSAWPRGKQNVSVAGVFGYTDPDGSPEGMTPSEIRRVAMMLVYRELLTLTSADREDRRLRHLVTSETVRDQSIARKFAGDAKGGCTAFTGDPDIDGIILRYRRGMGMGAA
jgi:hypothetical protein